MDYIAVLTTGTERTTVVRPIVEYMQRNLQGDFPEMDFTYTDDEYVRITPGLYELWVHWYPGVDNSKWFVDRLHLKSPNKFDTVNQVFDLIGDGSSFAFLRGVEPYVRKQLLIIAETHNTDKFHCLKFRW